MASLRRYYQVDILDVFRDKISVDEVWELLMQLPRESPFWAEVAADPHFASSSAPKPKTLAEFSPEVEALAAVHDQVASLRATVVALCGGKPGRITPYPRPVLAAAKRDKAADANWDRWEAQLLGKGSGVL